MELITTFKNIDDLYRQLIKACKNSILLHPEPSVPPTRKILLQRGHSYNNRSILLQEMNPTRTQISNDHVFMKKRGLGPGFRALGLGPRALGPASHRRVKSYYKRDGVRVVP